jgi:M6 family metalloprotease-like protein
MSCLPIKLSISNNKPFIGSFERIKVEIGNEGPSLDDLHFSISDGEAGGQISFARDDLSTPDEVMLLVGYRPGKYKIEVSNKAGSILGELVYESVVAWHNKHKSPAQWMAGELLDFVTGFTWGGGPGTVQNVDVMPQSGTRNICILTVDTNTARFPSGSAFDAIVSTFVGAAVGVTPGPDGKVKSAKTFYEEVSHGTFSLGLAGGQALSIGLPDTWDNLFTDMNTLFTTTAFPNNSYGPTDQDAFAKACVTAAAALKDGSGTPLVDFLQVQTLIMVIRSAGPASTDKFFWPQAWGGSFNVPGGSVNMRVLGMPDNWSTHDSRELYDTMSHELGHNLGYPDLYTTLNPLYSAEIQSRDITNFDLMSREARLPHMTVGQKLETGWIRPEWVQTFDFSRSTVPVDKPVTLQAIELGAPPAGGNEFAAVEIRIADGWNYYFEYRKGQVTQIGDQSLGLDSDTGDAVVLGTDMISQNFNFPIARPQIMRLRKDAEGENSFFTEGENYTELDSSSSALSDFKMSVLSISGNTAQIRIQYGTNGRPDLYIRPWPGGNIWQSPDIIVENDKTRADPSLVNEPWVGHANTVIASYRNRGPVTATNVTVSFYIVDFTVGGAPKVLLGTDTRDVPPETAVGAVQFQTNWTPQDDGHKCIIVETPLYIDTSVNPNIVEITDSNNSAQSNYTKYIAASSSPAKRGIFSVAFSNPYQARTRISVIPQIQGRFARFYRLYLETTSLWLEPGETDAVQVMVESLYGDPRLGFDIDKKIGKDFFREDIKMSLRGYGLPPHDPVRPVLLGGASMNVNAGKGTRFAVFKHTGNALSGQVVTLDDSREVTGQVLLNFVSEPKPRMGTSIAVQLTEGGHFALTEVDQHAKKFSARCVTAHYLGASGLAPCDAKDELHL